MAFVSLHGLRLSHYPSIFLSDDIALKCRAKMFRINTRIRTGFINGLCFDCDRQNNCFGERSRLQSSNVEKTLRHLRMKRPRLSRTSSDAQTPICSDSGQISTHLHLLLIFFCSLTHMSYSPLTNLWIARIAFESRCLELYYTCNVFFVILMRSTRIEIVV